MGESTRLQSDHLVQDRVSRSIIIVPFEDALLSQLNHVFAINLNSSTSLMINNTFFFVDEDRSNWISLIAVVRFIDQRGLCKNMPCFVKEKIHSIENLLLRFLLLLVLLYHLTGHFLSLTRENSLL